MSAEESTAEPRRRVLVVGIDGVTLDTLAAVPTPHLDSVAEAGFLAPVTIDPGTPTMSGPCWATVATGVRIDKHAVWGNDFSGNRLHIFPDFASRLTAEHGAHTYVAAGWQPLLTVAHGGPLFRTPSRTTYIAAPADTVEAWDATDEAITREAVRVLTEDDPEASFVYLGAVDETGHLLGCGAAYEEAVARADARLGRLLDALRARAAYAEEEWTVIVVTDHGHRPEGGHGGRSARETTAWIAARGPGIAPGEPERELRHEDVAAQVFASLGRAVDSHATLDGWAWSKS
ncbi:alkaline phosphatase family protein [Streptomyces indicus]|uniref:Type I phosphodiesterase / nucleotide pyrophosphatase n=1 Tax=Streptomyces indicus TaxID=417292 RepID=A0A1G8V139_9ACTN|nr:Type I phosphodiesterase / nucleotide pyrophosphatase [Streptomyces indicus]